MNIKVSDKGREILKDHPIQDESHLRNKIVVMMQIYQFLSLKTAISDKWEWIDPG
jgi:hypothetical protein